MPRIEDVPAPMLERYFKKLFSIADVNGDGVLSPQEFKRLLELSGFAFSAEQVRSLLNQADTNQNGVIEYEEFIPVAMSLLSAQQSNIDTYIDNQDDNAARRLLLEGKTQQQLERQLRKMFLFADEDCSGFLDQREFKKCMGQMGLPLNASQTSELMGMVDINRDGKISYEEFIPCAFEILVKVVSGKIQPKAAKPRAAAQPRTRPAGGMSAGGARPAARGRPQKKDDDVASLEGRVLAVQSRRIIRSKIKDLFARLDTDKDGRLTIPELASAIGDSMARRIRQTLDRANDGRVTQFEMRKFFDDECSKAVENGLPEYRYLEGIVEMLESA
jgi:Ca2+-binding EF-hand superfamily protein